MLQIKINRYFALYFVYLVVLPLMVQGQKEGFNRQRLVSPDITRYTLFNINNITGWIGWDGTSGFNPYAWEAGVYYPKGTTNVVYQDGIVWGGFVRDGNPNLPDLRVGGQTYIVGTAPGRILAPGVAQDPSDPQVRIYRIRRDWQSVSDEELWMDAAELNNLDPSRVTRDQIDAVRSQYETDWEQWPVDYGAPFYDENHNGIYEPQLGEEPGLQNADQVIWFVCNDLDSGQTVNLYGSPPIGLELQVTMWGFNTNPTLNETVFRRYRLINKSGYDFDSAFVALWTDTDIGESGNDFLGCDTLLQLGYAYNAYSTDGEYDKFGLPPPAFGYTLLQGPLVPSSGDEGVFDFSRRVDYRNLPITSFFYYLWLNIPDFHDYSSTLKWYKILNGYFPNNEVMNDLMRYIIGAGPEKGKSTKFPLSGDPVSGTGDVDGMGDNFGPGDRRFAQCSGPFRLQPGDTQEVVIALVGGINPKGDHLSNIVRLKDNIRTIRGFYGTTIHFPRHTSAQLDYPDDSRSHLQVSLNLDDFEGVSAAELYFTPSTGYEPPFSRTLYDDGQHGDSLSRDGIWGNTVTVPNRKYPVDGNLIVNSSAGRDTFTATYSRLQLRPPPQVEDFQVSWENGRQDGEVNYGEEVHLAFRLKNRDALNGIDFLRVSVEQGRNQRNSFTSSQSIGPGELVESADLYALLTGPYSGNSLSFRLRLGFDGFYQVEDLSYPIIPWEPDSLWGKSLPVEIMKGFSSNTEAFVADPTRLTGHEYVIHFIQRSDTAEGALGWQLRDRSNGEIKLREETFPAGEHPAYPVIDGIEFRVRPVLQGFASFQVVANAAGPIDPPEMGCFAFYGTGFPILINGLYPYGTDRPTRYFQQSTNRSVWGVHAAMDSSKDGSFAHFKAIVTHNGDYLSRISPFDYELRFTEDGGAAGILDSIGMVINVPFEMWNIGIKSPEETEDDYRMIPFVKDLDSNGLFNINPVDHVISGGDNDPETDAIYWFNPLDRTPGESGYESAASSSFTAGVGEGVMSAMVLVNWNGGSVNDPDFPENLDAVMPESGTIFRIISNKPNRVGDSLLVRAPSAHPDKLYDWPYSYQLSQNFPNPFNSGTVILFELPQPSPVWLEIFNVLGQRVRVLLDDVTLERGYHRIHWDGRNGNGIPLGSGIYMYRFKAGTYDRIQKMILIK